MTVEIRTSIHVPYTPRQFQIAVFVDGKPEEIHTAVPEWDVARTRNRLIAEWSHKADAVTANEVPI